ncbi:NAD(P)-dependent oxidoreductase [Frondihabitans sucicola]|uniref:NAD(P)-dependent oxidoreductase n=1 Tax=Frondihabitans sucicola TaxID=1268041 RepID=A0ABM8GKM3_9MICO|nr:SDR family oxidoreductase [Frondihabitans sucicola]BDZ48760.1 NAD(P)-dependent oxidoreductase [Frondihabitans sucicola]
MSDQQHQPRIAVTGASGHIGGLVAAELAGAGIPQRLIVRDAARAPQLDGAEVAVASYGDREASVRALAGAEILLMVSAAEAPDRLQQHLDFVEAAAEAGVKHIVYTSFVGAAEDALFTLARDHWATEEKIRASGSAFTILRDSFYLDFVSELVGEDGVIRGPAGDGAMAAVARADVAAVAAAVLRDPAGHVGASYDLTGPEAFTLTAAADLLTKATGRVVTYRDETLEEAYASREKWNPEKWQADAWVSTYTSIASGELAQVSGDVERVTGRAPLSLEQLLA